MISLGVGDEVTRSSTSNQSEQDPGPSLIVPSTSGAISSEVLMNAEEETPQSQEVVQQQQQQPPATNVQPSCSSSSSSLASSSSSSFQVQAVRAHTITTSTSSPAICDMEVGASSSHSGRDVLGSDDVAAGSSSKRGTVASELNLGHTVGM